MNGLLSPRPIYTRILEIIIILIIIICNVGAAFRARSSSLARAYRVSRSPPRVPQRGCFRRRADAGSAPRPVRNRSSYTFNNIRKRRLIGCHCIYIYIILYTRYTPAAVSAVGHIIAAIAPFEFGSLIQINLSSRSSSPCTPATIPSRS